MRNTSDFFGLLAYLTLMYGRLPDREMLNAAYAATSEEPEARPVRHLTLVPPPPEQPPLEEPERASAAA